MHYHSRAGLVLINYGNLNYISKNQSLIKIKRIVFGFRKTDNLFSFIYRKSVIASFHDQILLLIYDKMFKQYENGGLSYLFLLWCLWEMFVYMLHILVLETCNIFKKFPCFFESFARHLGFDVNLVHHLLLRRVYYNTL